MISLVDFLPMLPLVGLVILILWSARNGDICMVDEWETLPLDIFADKRGADAVAHYAGLIISNSAKNPKIMDLEATKPVVVDAPSFSRRYRLEKGDILHIDSHRLVEALKHTFGEPFDTAIARDADILQQLGGSPSVRAPRCVYCGGLMKKGEVRCHSCGASP